MIDNTKNAYTSTPSRSAALADWSAASLFKETKMTRCGCILHTVAMLTASIALLLTGIVISGGFDDETDQDLANMPVFSSSAHFTPSLMGDSRSGLPLQQRANTVKEKILQLEEIASNQHASVQHLSASNADLLRRIMAVEAWRTAGMGRATPIPHQTAMPAGMSGMAGMAAMPHLTQAGLTYIRWGRRTCPQHLRNITQIVYEGLAAGSLSSQPGSGSNTMCLPLTPTWGNFSDMREAGGQIFGAEYRFGPGDGFNVFENTGTGGRLSHRKVPCAVCHTRLASSVLMVPASTLCPLRWQQQYNGYLMSERFDHHKSQYICVDREAEASVLGSQLPREGLGLYPVEASCGALPCAPYMANRELTCSVCTI
ncbi:uncharacterized protein LOC135818036 isoform X2 [Sycon ciliatum]